VGPAFTGWRRAGTVTGACNATTDARKSVTADFTPTSVLAVAQAGTGSGGVASSPSGINCGATCSAEYLTGTPVALTKKEFGLLCTFAEHANQVLSRDQLLERVWGPEYIGDGRLVDSHIRRLRTKIERDPETPEFLHTLYGVGYRFQEKVHVA